VIKDKGLREKYHSGVVGIEKYDFGVVLSVFLPFLNGFERYFAIFSVFEHLRFWVENGGDLSMALAILWSGFLKKVATDGHPASPDNGYAGAGRLTQVCS